MRPTSRVLETSALEDEQQQLCVKHPAVSWAS